MVSSGKGIPYEYVKCRLCGKKFKSVEYSHLMYKHGITIEEYERMFPESPRVSINTLIRLGRIKEAEEIERKWKEGKLRW